ncbi:hypothetical protein SAMN02746089_01811 [Caldanaerobius fijiensis DSM 17918]|uniref:Uncharacterized protein n=1 Tax=Caldanaerobius fijiensis DSM 17918 TaxID=1121256 RepID=A0A1M5B8Q0_9THEO|nr:hypothetical protein [Caldanaerobius fijiensis]SHF38552.1 hypothetical protein SAMN02746089_01811 [Caldanaerobius fijiensis DSM 17918]
MDYDKLFEMIKNLKSQMDMSNTEEFKKFVNELMTISDKDFNDNIDRLALKLKDIISKIKLPEDVNPYDIKSIFEKMSQGNNGLSYEKVMGFMSALDPNYKKAMMRLNALSEKLKK